MSTKDIWETDEADAGLVSGMEDEDDTGDDCGLGVREGEDGSDVSCRLDEERFKSGKQDKEADESDGDGGAAGAGTSVLKMSSNALLLGWFLNDAMVFLSGRTSDLRRSK